MICMILFNEHRLSEYSIFLLVFLLGSSCVLGKVKNFTIFIYVKLNNGQLLLLSIFVLNNESPSIHNSS